MMIWRTQHQNMSQYSPVYTNIMVEIIDDDLEDTAPEYEPVFTSVYQYYGNSLASFTNTMDDLLLQLPILIKLKVQVPMSLFSIETVPVPLDAEKLK